MQGVLDAGLKFVGKHATALGVVAAGGIGVGLYAIISSGEKKEEDSARLMRERDINKIDSFYAAPQKPLSLSEATNRFAQQVFCYSFMDAPSALVSAQSLMQIAKHASDQISAESNKILMNLGIEEFELKKDEDEEVEGFTIEHKVDESTYTTTITGKLEKPFVIEKKGYPVLCGDGRKQNISKMNQVFTTCREGKIGNIGIRGLLYQDRKHMLYIFLPNVTGVNAEEAGSNCVVALQNLFMSESLFSDMAGMKAQEGSVHVTLPNIQLQSKTKKLRETFAELPIFDAISNGYKGEGSLQTMCQLEIEKNEDGKVDKEGAQSFQVDQPFALMVAKLNDEGNPEQIEMLGAFTQFGTKGSGVGIGEDHSDSEEDDEFSD